MHASICTPCQPADQINAGCPAGETVSAEYSLEYGTDKIEMHVDHVKKGQRVLLMDDLIATGGTLAAGAQLIKQVYA